MLALKAREFFKRDLRIESSYKAAFLFEYATTLLPLLTFYFVAKLMRGDSASSLTPYGGKYFPFVVVGVAFMQYFTIALTNFAATIRRSQMAGCLEAMLAAQTSPGMVIILSSAYSFLVKLFHLVFVLTASALLLGVNFGPCNFLSMAVILVLTIASLSGLGILSAAFIVVMKKGDPIEWFIGSVSSMLGGALFPVSLMPEWLRMIAALLPTTYALEALRQAMLNGASIPMLWRDVLILGAFAVVLLPVGVWVFAKAVDKGRRDGTLMHY
jgi:ABC-2 type transport system permease protein